MPDLDHEARARQAEHVASLAVPAGALAGLEELSLRAAAATGRVPAVPFRRPRLLLVAADHGVVEAGVTAYPSWVTAAVVRAALEGRAACSALAAQTGVGVRVVDAGVDVDWADGEVAPDVVAHKVRRGSGRLDREDALTAREVDDALAAGASLVDDEVDAGTDVLLLGEVGMGSTTPAAVLCAALLGLEPTVATGRGAGIDDATWARKVAAVRDGLRRARPDVDDPRALLSRAGGAELAVLAGALAQAARRRTPVLLDGAVVTAAALVAERLAPGASAWWWAGHVSPEPVHVLALRHLGLEPLLDLGLRVGEGTGALVALGVVQQALAVTSATATLADLGIAPPP